MFNQLNYWLLARLPRWLVVALYTLVAIVLVSGGLVALAAFVTQNIALVIALMFVVIVLSLMVILFKGIADTINNALPRRKQKNDERAVPDRTPAEQTDIAMEAFHRQLEWAERQYQHQTRLVSPIYSWSSRTITKPLTDEESRKLLDDSQD